MNEVLKTIFNRRAVRKYKSQPVAKKVIEELLDAGRMAPSGMNLQPWKFYVVDDREFIHSMDKAINSVVKGIYRVPEMEAFLRDENAIFHDAPLVIFITAPKENEWAALDVGMCAQNIMLTAKSVGLDSCPIGLGKFIENTSLYKILGVSATEHVLLALSLGYGNEEPPVHDRRKDNVVFVKAAVTVVS